MGDFHREPRPGKGYIRILKLKTPSTDRLKEKQTRSIFFLKLKAPQCKANGLFATTLSSHNKLHWPLKLSISIVFIYLEIYNRRKRNRMLTQYWHIHVSHEHGNLFSVGSFICQTGFKTIDCLLSLQRNKITDLNIKIKSTIL